MPQRKAGPLNSQHQNLSEELNRTKRVMEGLLDEYNAAFGHQAATKIETAPPEPPDDDTER